MKCDKDKCVGCGICAFNCPMEAITIVEGKCTIDPKKCVDCHTCSIMCPMQALEI